MHADQLAQRIVQLGGEPDFSPEGLATRSHAECVVGDNWVFVFTNAMMLIAALAGLAIDPRNRRLAAPAPAAA